MGKCVLQGKQQKTKLRPFVKKLKWGDLSTVKTFHITSINKNFLIFSHISVTLRSGDIFQTAIRNRGIFFKRAEFLSNKKK